MATHSSIRAWRIPWTEEPGGLQSTGLQRVGHDLTTKSPPGIDHSYYFFLLLLKIVTSRGILDIELQIIHKLDSNSLNL